MEEEAVPLQLQLPVTDPAFELVKTVCSHGLFMMAPNQWEPATATLFRPLRLASSSTYVYARIAQPSTTYLIIFLFISFPLSTLDRHYLLEQVRRMLRLSETSDRVVEQFHQFHPAAKEKGFGRLFRSPTLFEDMVKCILLCNCNWERSLIMTKALCEFQLELSQSSKSADISQPQEQPLPRPRTRKHPSTKRARTKLETKLQEECDTNEKLTNEIEKETYEIYYENSEIINKLTLANLDVVGDFPTAVELAYVDVNYLANHCKLGYRAKTIVSVAKYVISHKVEFGEFEQVCDGSSISHYNKLNTELCSINGLGPFTCTSILMCMGFYHKIPVDTETRRHLKQFHAEKTSSSTKPKAMEKKLEKIYGEYAPFQYLAYWYELWGSYEASLGKAMNMAPCDYKLATSKGLKKNKSCRGEGR